MPMTNAEKAKLLRSAASALEHGRLRTASKKIAQAVKPYLLVTISGGVAEIAINEGDVEIDLLDYDNLESTAADDLLLSDREWEWLKEHDADLFEFFAPSYAKREEA
jgi:hypothetical protein